MSSEQNEIKANYLRILLGLIGVELKCKDEDY